METAVIIIICLVTLGFVASPFLQPKREWEDNDDQSMKNKMKNQKDIYYQAIKDVDFEYAEGKLSESDHDELRDYYKEKAIQTLKSIDSIDQNTKKSADETNVSNSTKDDTQK